MQALSVIDAELASQDVLKIRVFDESNRLFIERAHEGAESVQATDLMRVELRWRPTLQADAQLGSMDILFSREYVERVMFIQIRNRVIEIILLNGLLCLVLYGLMSRMVVTPLSELAQAFSDLASNAQVGELKIKGEDEFGDVVDAFNRIERRLVSDIERRIDAERGLLQSNKELSEALENLKLAQDSLVQSEKFASLGQLVVGVAHDLNTPVGLAVTGASFVLEQSRKMGQQLEQGAVRKSDLTKFLGMIDEGAELVLGNVERAAHLIQSFKQVAVDETSEERRKFEMKDYLDEVLTSLRPKYKHTAICVSCECPDGLEMDTYPGLLTQVVSNLLINALTHGFGPDDKGAVKISVLDEGAWVGIECWNDGRPIPAKHLNRIFDPFLTTRRGQGGTGLGLNIVANIVTQRLGGAIRLASDSEQGTRFVVRIPKIFVRKESAGR